MNQSQKVFNGRFLVKKKISAGSFGVVFLGIDKNSQDQVAIKLEKEDNSEVKSLDRESQILTQLQGVVGVPNLYWAGEEQDYNILVIQLLGKDLSYHIKTLRRFTLKTVVLLAHLAVPIMERVHNKGVVHRDLKPENILLAIEGDPQPLYLVDYGISKVFKDNNNNHMPFKEKRPFIGTTRYASIAAHKGQEISRKDDLESLFFVLLFFLRGSLPWQNLQVPDKERTKAVGDMKSKITPSELCKGFPQEFVQIFENIRKLSFKETPDYSQIMNYLTSISRQNNFEFDGMFDWSEPVRLEQSRSPNSKQSQEVQNLEKSPNNLQDSRILQQFIWSFEQGVQVQQNEKIAQKLLIPPDGMQKPQSPNERQEHLVSQLGSFSSMKMRYVPSQVNVEEKKGKDNSEDKKLSSRSIVLQEEGLLEQWNSQSGMEIDENVNEIPLWNRYYKLKVTESYQYYLKMQKFIMPI